MRTPVSLLQLPTQNQPSSPPSDSDGDIFCSGHVWTKEGLFVVAGGTVYNGGTASIDGSRLVYIWDPLK